MTRSRKKSPFFGISTSVSEKADKVAAHKRERRKVRTRIKVDPETEPLPHTREVSNIWAYAKDGPKRYRKHVDPKRMRK
jgi:hypothetical protein